MATPSDEGNAPKERIEAGTVTALALPEARDGASTIAAKDSNPESPKPIPAVTDDVTAIAHQFVSTASNEMLCGVALGLIVCIYLILGRLGLVLIGVFGGILLHATWEGNTIPISELEDIRKENALDIMKRVLDWRERRAVGSNDEPEQLEELTVTGRDFEGLPTETGAALKALVEAIVENYVVWWYSPIIPTDGSFPATCRHTLTAFLRSVSIHMSRKRPADLFLDILTNSSSIFIVFINELSTAITASLGTSVSTANAIHMYLSSRPESNLASIVDRPQQKRKFRLIAEDILQCFLDKPVYECIQARVFLKEMLVSVVLEMSLSACSKPEWINGWIVYLLEDDEPELNQVIDVGLGSVPSSDLDAGFENAKFAESKQTEERKHRKRLSKAEEAMEEAVREAKRLSQLIAESDERRAQGLENPALSIEPNERPQNGINSTPAAGGESQATNLESASDNSARFPTLMSMLDHSAVGSEKAPGSSFTSFDQLVPPVQVTAVQPEPQRPRRQTTSLTLCNANIIIHDDPTVNDRGRIGSKPTTDYLIQIEPESSEYPGWMIVRRYPDFEALHEVLRRIAKIAGVAAFTEQHNALPSWKTHTRSSLRGELERYLRDACWHQPLAECEGMKHFLEKDQSNMQISSSKGLNWPTPATFENMGKGVLDVLTSAPKGAAEGGKAVLGGVFGGISSLGQKKKGSMSNTTFHTAGKFSISTLPRLESTNSFNSSRSGTEDERNPKLSPVIHTQPVKITPMERKPSNISITENGFENETRKGRTSMSSRSSLSGQNSTYASRDPSQAPLTRTNPSTPTQATDVESIVLPPPPSEIPDDYGSPVEEPSLGRSRSESLATTTRTSTSTAPSLQSPSSILPTTAPAFTQKPRREASPLTEQETRVTVELLFACVNELYTLSSVWKFRRTLLMAAKSFLLRPGNPSLTAIQALIQDSVIASNVSDPRIAAQLRKLREYTMPTEEERNAWPLEMTSVEKERLRVKARKLLVERGLPSALTGVMGQVATGEAMGRVFDCLQVEEVARGLLFGLLLQGIRALTH